MHRFSLDLPQLSRSLVRSVHPIGPLLFLALSTGCQRPAPPLVEPPPPEVVVATPLTRDLAETLEFTGNAAAVETVEIKARVSGFITEVHFE
ncbi:MAG: hypothetical protein ACO37F_09520, partial [Pirellulales bacterium]